MLNKFVAIGLGAVIALGALWPPWRKPSSWLRQSTPATPAPAAAPAKATGTHGMQRRAGRRTTRHQRRATRHGHPAPAAPMAPKS